MLLALAAVPVLAGAARAHGGQVHLTGRGRRATADAGLDRARVDGEVVPLLLSLLRTERDADILDSCVLAVARAADASQAAAVVESALPLLGSREASVQSSAALALGVLGSPLAAPHLRALMTDSMDGRGLTGRRGRVPDRVRAFACVSLGMLCELAEPPWHARLTEGGHDLALVPALAEVLDIL